MTFLLPRLANAGWAQFGQASRTLAIGPSCGVGTSPLFFTRWARTYVSDTSRQAAYRAGVGSGHRSIPPADLLPNARRCFSTPPGRTMFRSDSMSKNNLSKAPTRSPKRTLRQPSQIDPATNHRRAVAVIALIVLINLCIFLLWYRAERATDDNAKLSAMYERFTASWLAIHFGDYLGLLTCCFSHSDATHLFVNMVAFATVAVGMTAFLGGRSIFALYVGAGCLSTLVTLAWEKFYIRPGSPNGLPTPSFHLGASGSVFAFLALSAALAPRQTFYLFFVIPVQARILLPAIALFEVLCCLDEQGVGKKWHENVVKPLLGDVKIDSAAHLGGMAAGYAYAILLLRRRGRGRHLFR